MESDLPGRLKQDVRTLYEWLLAREPSFAEVETAARELAEKRISREQFVPQLALSAENMKNATEEPLACHLNHIHSARIRMVRPLLPTAGVMVDFRGANGSIYDMHYPYIFERVIVDLPRAHRHAIYQDISVQERVIHVLRRSMLDLAPIPDSSVDLVWSGRSIEHVSREDARIMLAETHRILRPRRRFLSGHPEPPVDPIAYRMVRGWVHPPRSTSTITNHGNCATNSSAPALSSRDQKVFARCRRRVAKQTLTTPISCSPTH